MTLEVPDEMSLSFLSGTIAQPPRNLFSVVKTRHVHGNSSGLAWPSDKPDKVLKLLCPQVFPELKFLMLSLHPCSQNTLGLLLLLRGTQLFPKRLTSS